MCIFKKLKENISKQEDEIQVDLLKQIVKLAKVEKEMYISTVQRKCSVGFEVASEHIEWLVENGFLTKSSDEMPNYSLTDEQYKKFKKSKIK